jgi:two-component system LytT family response regulator
MGMAGQLRAVIVDDEERARFVLHSLLDKHPNVEVAGQAERVDQAAQVIREMEPDVVFLDTELPDRSGFELLEKVDPNFKLVCIASSAHHAVQAFEVNAIDYLVKPIQPRRLGVTITRLLGDEARSQTAIGRKLEYDGRLFVTVDERSVFLKVSRIECIQSAGDYSEVITTDNKEMLVPIPLREWEERLPENYFARIHRSTIVNLEYVERVEKWFNYTYHLFLRGFKEPLCISRRYVARLKDRYR